MSCLLSFMQLKTEIYRSLRKVMGDKNEDQRVMAVQYQGQPANDLMREMLLSGKPCLIGRFGSNELDTTLRVFERKNGHAAWKRMLRYFRGYGGVYWTAAFASE